MTNAAYKDILKSYFEGNNRALERFIKNRSHALCEVNLVRTRQHLRKGKYAVAWEILKTIAPNSDFTAAEVAILKASIHSYHSRWQEAIAEALLAVQFYRLCQDPRGMFVSNYNLSVYYGRLGLDSLSNRYLDNAKEWMATPTQKSLYFRAKACELSRQSDFALAVVELEQALALQVEIDPVDRAALLNVAADIYFRADQPLSAIQCLEEVAQSKAIRDKARIRFDLLVMRALVNQERQIVPNSCPDSIKDNEEYFLRWKVLSALQSGEHIQAESAWSRLVDLFPQRFKADFEVVASSDEKMLFIRAIRTLIRTPHVSVPLALQVTGKTKELLTLLQTAKTPLRKEDLIERIWDCSYEPSFDNRFYKLMGRLRQHEGVKVEVILNTYRLAK